MTLGSCWGSQKTESDDKDDIKPQGEKRLVGNFTAWSDLTS